MRDNDYKTRELPSLLMSLDSCLESKHSMGQSSKSIYSPGGLHGTIDFLPAP